MKLFQLTVLVIGIQLWAWFGCATTAKESSPQEPKIVVIDSAEPVGEVTPEQTQSIREEFYRMVRESNDDRETYDLLKMASELLKKQ